MRLIRFTRQIMNRAHWVLVLLVADHVIAGLLFSAMEGKSIGDGQWWATVTGFTVGYGDYYPQGGVARGMAMFYIISMAVLWLVLGAHIVATLIEDKHLFTNEEQERLEACMLEIAQKLGIIPHEFTKMPSTEWFTEKKGFIADEE